MHDIGSADLTPMEQVSYFFSPLLRNRISQDQDPTQLKKRIQILPKSKVNKNFWVVRHGICL